MANAKTTVPGSGYGSIYLDTLIWGGTAWNPAGGPITFHFGETEDFASASEVHGESYFLSEGDVLGVWSDAEKAAFRSVMDLYSGVCGLTFAPASSAAAADIVWWQADLDLSLGEGTLGVHNVPSPKQSWGVFNHTSTSWRSLQVGGDGFNTIIHEIGHGLGLAHPHDGGSGPGPQTFPGTGPYDPGDPGTHGLNQGIYTVMSYNTGWDGETHGLSWGAQGGLGAFDIAALQRMYGANLATRTGNDTYGLPGFNGRGTGWSCIWDAGGSDTISAGTIRSSVTIDLRPATLRDNDPHAGGYISHAEGVSGGFTIAHGVLVENAIGGFGNDTLVGNASANALAGGAGADRLRGLKGKDVLTGGSGADEFVFDVTLNALTNVDRIRDFRKEDSILLNDSVFRALRGMDDLERNAFHATRSSKLAHDNTDRIIHHLPSGKLYYDPDGTGSKAPILFAILEAGARVSALDFFIT